MQNQRAPMLKGERGEWTSVHVARATFARRILGPCSGLPRQLACMALSVTDAQESSQRPSK